MLATNSSEYGRALNGDTEVAEHSRSDKRSCPKFLVFVGSRGTLLQVGPSHPCFFIKLHIDTCLFAFCSLLTNSYPGSDNARLQGVPAPTEQCGRFYMYYNFPVVQASAHLGIFLQAVDMVDYSPVFQWLPMALPQLLKQILEYTFSVSAMLALFNMAPIRGLDGEMALLALLEMGGSNSHRYDLGRKGRNFWGLGYKCLHAVLIVAGTAMFGFLVVFHALRISGYSAPCIRALAAIRHLLTFSVRIGWWLFEALDSTGSMTVYMLFSIRLTDIY